MPLSPNPDFELYDNVGRTTEQIHAHNTGSPTADDLQRWDAAAAKPLIDAAGLPPSGHGIAGWTDLLGQAATGSHFHGIASAVLDHDEGAVARLHQFLVTAATWYDERGDQTSSRHYQGLADRFDELADDMVQLTEDLARTAYHHTTTAARATRPEPSPAPPPAPPGAGKPPRR
ncbi:hypothetical protein [Streptomyces sp. CA-111067]|uniref:hypothetical protein n=1 Tax=Streptomyces sp. CA-111067 TaxID=3240046 RepID=UPI003D981186